MRSPNKVKKCHCNTTEETNIISLTDHSQNGTFQGFKKGSASTWEPPVTLPQPAAFSGFFKNSTTQPEPPVENTFNCVINAPKWCIYSSSVNSQAVLHLGKLKKASKASLLLGFSSLPAMLNPNLKFDVSPNSAFKKNFFPHENKLVERLQSTTVVKF